MLGYVSLEFLCVLLQRASGWRSLGPYFSTISAIAKRGAEAAPIRKQRSSFSYAVATPVALFAQPRGVKETIAGQFERQVVYFGIINQDGVHQFLEDKVLLDSWIREYRQQFYVMRGLTCILICFIVQLIAASLPANKPSGGNSKSPCLTRNVGHQERRNVERAEEFPQETISC